MECPRCFWLQLNQGLRRPSSIFPSLPAGMDRILKAHFDLYRGQLPPDLEGSLGTLNGTLYPDKAKLAVWRNNRQGLRFQHPSGCTLMGALDDLFVTSEGRYAPLDFKTRGYPLKDDTTEHYQHQMDLYAFLLEQNKLPPAGFALLVFYHPDTVIGPGQMKFHIDIKQVPASPEKGLQLFEQAISCLQGPEPPVTQACSWCRLVG